MGRINETVPWLQDGMTVTLEKIEKMKSPRVFKTHDYWSWLPEKLRETARFIYCTRNPKDQAVSYFHHLKTMRAVYGEKCGRIRALGRSQLGLAGAEIEEEYFVFNL